MLKYKAQITASFGFIDLEGSFLQIYSETFVKVFDVTKLILTRVSKKNLQRD